MDAIVESALHKWPHVPHCYGWLALDARGDWYMRDDRARAAGPFPRVKGSRIVHEALRAFIHRNYACDAGGNWFFQNGPQRVYVELEAAPWVWRLNREAGALRIASHTGGETRFESAWLDEHGRLFLSTDTGLGLVHSLDVPLAAEEVEQGRWTPTEIRFEDLPQGFGYRLRPAP